MKPDTDTPKSSAVPVLLQRVFLIALISSAITQMVYTFLILSGTDSEIDSMYFWRTFGISYGVPLLFFFASYFIHPPTTTILTRVFNSAALTTAMLLVTGMVNMLILALPNDSGDGYSYQNYDLYTWITQGVVYIGALGTMLFLRLKKRWQ